MNKQPFDLDRLVALAFSVVLLASCQPSSASPGSNPTLAPSTPTAVPAPASPTPGVGVLPGTPGPLPDMPVKPAPQGSTFNGCPPQGQGGDPALNELKNRIDLGAYVPVQFNAVEQLPWPKTIERRDRAEWSASDKAVVARYEGIPVAVRGYLFGAKEQGPESTNCESDSAAMHDFHIWLTRSAGEDRTQSIVVEATPRLRAQHPGWTVRLLDQVAKSQQKVRISGWLMLDPEHPDQVGKTRGTIWEIHPIMQIEVDEQGKWVTLDSLANGP